MYQIIKRLFDIVCALIGILITAPVWVVAVIGILLSDFGPIFYVAQRIGKDNKMFRMYKFRSMRIDRDADERSLRPDQDRIFPFGNFIRKVKIDELPQLLNVLNGTMSFVGPRPVAKDQFGMFRTGKWAEAAKFPAGLSGPAALYDFVYGDTITDQDEYMDKVFPTRRELEYTYSRKASFFYDLKIIFWTMASIIYAVFGKECNWMLQKLKQEAAETME